jgi:hypothetical protein
VELWEFKATPSQLTFDDCDYNVSHPWRTHVELDIIDLQIKETP